MKMDIIIKTSNLNKKGVFAARNFKKGEVVLQWKPKQILTKEQVEKLPDSEKRYVSNYNPGEYIVQQIPDRYVNHACEPNTEVKRHSDVAIRDIQNGEEITSDYTKDTVQLVHFECGCGSKNCKKVI